MRPTEGNLSRKEKTPQSLQLPDPSLQEDGLLHQDWGTSRMEQTRSRLGVLGASGRTYPGAPPVDAAALDSLHTRVLEGRVSPLQSASSPAAQEPCRRVCEKLRERARCGSEISALSGLCVPRSSRSSLLKLTNGGRK